MQPLRHVFTYAHSWSLEKPTVFCDIAVASCPVATVSGISCSALSAEGQTYTEQLQLRNETMSRKFELKQTRFFCASKPHFLSTVVVLGRVPPLGAEHVGI